TLDGHAIRLGRLLVGESDLALERSLDRSDADLHHRPELIVAEGFEFLAPGNRLTKALGIEKCLPNFLPGRGNIVSAFDLHRLDLLCRAREMKGALVYQGTLCVALALQSQGTANGAIKQEGSPQMKKLLSAVFALVLGATMIAGCSESRSDRVGERPGTDRTPSASPGQPMGATDTATGSSSRSGSSSTTPPAGSSSSSSSSSPSSTTPPSGSSSK